MWPQPSSTARPSTGTRPNRTPANRSARSWGHSGGWRGSRISIVVFHSTGAICGCWKSSVAVPTRRSTARGTCGLTARSRSNFLTTVTPTGDAAATTIIEEGRLLARVRHPNVVTIYGADRIDDRVGLWMEFVKGRTLEQLLQQEHVFDLPDTLRVASDLCHAIAAVHDAGLLHRDVKAHNVMMDNDGRVVLMDFGDRPRTRRPRPRTWLARRSTLRQRSFGDNQRQSRATSTVSAFCCITCSPGHIPCRPPRWTSCAGRTKPATTGSAPSAWVDAVRTNCRARARAVSSEPLSISE